MYKSMSATKVQLTHRRVTPIEMQIHVNAGTDDAKSNEMKMNGMARNTLNEHINGSALLVLSRYH